MKIGLDIDGVLCNFVRGVLDLASEQGLDSYFPKSEKDVTHWNISEKFGTLIPLMRDNETFWKNLPKLTCPSKISFVPDCYITSRWIDSSVSEQWLLSHGFPKADVITVSDPLDKVDVAEERGLSVFIDDYYETVRALRESGINAILFKQPYQVGHKSDCADLPTIECLSEVRV